MELFRISCVTCRARLSVRNRSAIGQIVACPKCGSMVEIAPPGDWLDEGPGEQSQVAVRVTDSSLEESQIAAASGLSGPVSTAAEPRSAAVDQSGPALDEMAPSSAAQSSSVRSATDTASSNDLTASTENTGHAAGDPPQLNSIAAELAAGASALNYKVVAWTGAATLGGALLIGGLLFWRGDRPASEGTESPAARGTSAVAGETYTDLAPASARESDAVAAENLPAAAKSDSTHAASSGSEGRPPQLPELVNAVSPAGAENPSGETIGGASSSSSTSAAEVAESVRPAEESNRATSAAGDGIDPLEIDPEGLDLSILFEETTDPSAASDDFASVDAAGNASALAGAADDQSARPSQVDAVRLESSDDRDDQPADLVENAERRFPRFEIEQMPLCRFLDFMTQLSGVPISVAPAHLRVSGVGPAAEVSVQLENASFEEVLVAALKPRRLEPVRGEGQLLLESTREQIFREIEFPVDDLTSSELPVDELARWIGRLAAPASWDAPDVQLHADGDKIVIGQQVRIQYEVLVLLEKVRRSLDLPRRSNYPQQLISQESPYAELSEKLGGPATFTYSRFTPLRTIFRDWQEELAVAVLVDWPALAELQLHPQTRIACGVADKSWDESLDMVLEPLGLAWRAVDGPALQITSAAVSHADQQVQIYRIAEGSTLDAQQAAKRAAQIASDLGGDATGDDAAVIAHPSEPLILLRQPAPVHREFANWLYANGALSVESTD